MVAQSKVTRDITFVSSLPEQHQPQLEALLFFNRRQDKVLPGILDAISRYGAPEIVAGSHGLKVRVAGPVEAQCLFAVERAGGATRPVGVILYTRDSFERITVLHLVVAEEYAAGGPRADQHLLLRLVQAVRRVARRTSGIRHVELLYSHSRARAIAAYA
ncbi:MAG: hypothetical protein FIB01_11250 [Gemmatimonadetes bacterium]|nr:hypothetical protein [Gemmatimonadota bacterium]